MKAFMGRARIIAALNPLAVKHDELHRAQVSKTHFEELYIAPIPHFIIRWATFGSGIDFSGGGLSDKSCYFFCVSPQ